jgi:hypothetical protein
MRKQRVLSAPAKVLVGTYKTKSGQTKNRYKANPVKPKQLQEIRHIK